MIAIPDLDIRYAFFVARVVWGSGWGEKKCLPFRAEVLNGKQKEELRPLGEMQYFT
jgi:hypothetical protein